MTSQRRTALFFGSHQRSLALFIAASCAVLSCSANHARVVKLTASANYYKASYQEKCHSGVNNPAKCAPCQSIIQTADTRAQTANINDKLGYMPPQQVTEIDSTLVDLAGCP